MINNRIEMLKRLVYGLIGLFVLFFLIGFLDLGGKYLLAIILLYFVLGVGLNVLIFRSDTKGKLRAFLLLTGISSLVFSLGVSYGIIGIWGLYIINNLIYLGLVIASSIGFLIGAIGSVVLLINGGGQDVSSTQINK